MILLYKIVRSILQGNNFWRHRHMMWHNSSSYLLHILCYDIHPFERPSCWMRWPSFTRNTWLFSGLFTLILNRHWTEYYNSLTLFLTTEISIQICDKSLFWWIYGIIKSSSLLIHLHQYITYVLIPSNYCHLQWISHQQKFPHFYAKQLTDLHTAPEHSKTFNTIWRDVAEVRYSPH